jgi:hypothetical protein
VSSAWTVSSAIPARLPIRACNGRDRSGWRAPVSVLPPQRLTSAPCPLAAACRLPLGHLDAWCQSPPSLLACWRRPLRPSHPSPVADRDFCGCVAGMAARGRQPCRNVPRRGIEEVEHMGMEETCVGVGAGMQVAAPGDGGGGQR